MADVYFCRLCATQKAQSIDIYTEEGYKLKLEAKISKYLEIQVGQKDFLPKIVCHDCLEKLLLFEEFIECTKQAQITLKMLYSDVPCKVEVMDTKQENEVYNPLNEIEVNSDSKEAEECMNSHISSDGLDNKDTEECVNSHISSDGFSSVPGLQIVENNEITEEEKSNSEEKHEIISKAPNDLQEQINLKYKEFTNSNLTLEDNPEIHLSEVIENSRTLESEIVIDSTMGEEDLREAVVVSYPSHLEEASEERILETNQIPAELSNASLSDTSESSMLGITNAQLPRKRREGWDKYPWLCTDCDEELPTMQALRQHHLVAHNQQARFMCAECRKVYTKYYGFVSHVRRHKNHMKFCCEQCGKCFSNKKVLESHRGTHSDARPFICQECGKSFRQQSALYVHQKSHQPEDIKNRFPCDQCDKRFSTKPNLVTHKRIHTGIRNFTCEQCGKSFIQKGNLDAHILTHSVDKPHTCPICNKGFKTPLQLKKHTSVHTGAKPHQCDVCGRQFRERGTLREHHRIHTGAMPFTCEFCGKCFRFKGILTTHRRQHTGERPYSCLECQHHFTNWPNYNKHMKRRHGINTSIQPDPNKIAMAAAAEAAEVAANAAAAMPRIVVHTPRPIDTPSPLCETAIHLDQVYDNVTCDPLDLGNIEYHYTSASVPYDSNQSSQAANSSTPETSASSMLGYYSLSQLHVIEPQTTIDILQQR